MNPLTINPAIAIEHAHRQARESHTTDRRTSGRVDRAIRAARSARAALERRER
jgi:hypothetical protein